MNYLEKSLVPQEEKEGETKKLHSCAFSTVQNYLRYAKVEKEGRKPYTEKVYKIIQNQNFV